ncbi:MAG: hypothetical protein IPI68_10015 [Chitinophagaceae bacterium]|nr:hypothetical protein [Chitinophagaceae bacterium]
MQLKLLVSTAALFLVLSGCTKKTDETPVIPPDPSGTLSGNLGISGNLVLTNFNAGLIRDFMGNVTGVYSVGFSLNLDGSLNLNIANPLGGGAVNLPVYDIGLARVGAVGGLGSITTYPASGYSFFSSATEKNGYVIKMTDYDPITFRLDRVRRFRIYIESYQMSTAGGILGVRLKYQGPF